MPLSRFDRTVRFYSFDGKAIEYSERLKTFRTAAAGKRGGGCFIIAIFDVAAHGAIFFSFVVNRQHADEKSAHATTPIFDPDTN